MVEKINLIFQQITYLSGEQDIFLGEIGRAVWAVMGKQEHFCVVLFQELFQLVDIKGDLVCYTDGEYGAGGEFSRFIDTESTESFCGVAFEEVYKVPAERFKIVCLNGDKALFFGAAEDLSQKYKMFGAFYAHAFYLAKRIYIGGEDGVQIAEFIKQIMCGLTSIGTGNDIEQKHFQNFLLGEIAEVGIISESLPHTFAVP